MAVVSQPPAGNEELESPSPWIVPVLTLATFVAMLNAMALGPFLPVIADDLNTSVALLGQMAVLLGIAYFFVTQVTV
jgi:predicted MFS family arabinose efflux permease